MDDVGRFWAVLGAVRRRNETAGARVRRLLGHLCWTIHSTGCVQPSSLWSVGLVDRWPVQHSVRFWYDDAIAAMRRGPLS